jgi:glucose-6-phosphate 1-dehydrogenase
LSEPTGLRCDRFLWGTGDLAYKQIFPALQGLIRDEGLDIPIIGVAKAGWSLDQLKARAKDSLSNHGGLDTKAFAKLTSLLRYVDDDYNDPSTYVRLRQELGGCEATAPLSRHSSEPVCDSGREAREAGRRDGRTPRCREALRP